MPTAQGHEPMPEPLHQQTPTTYVLRDRIYKPANRENNWSAFVLVGREGSGKSHTCARILEDVDPTFDASRVFFDPLDLIEFIQSLSKPERKGKAVMLDEAGVGMGVRSWYDKEQIKVNKAFQTLRDDNMIVGMTLPSFGLLDSQLRTRLHGFCEMRGVVPGSHAFWSWKDIVVDREEGNREIKRKVFPRRGKGRRKEALERLGIGPPSQEFTEEYERRKEQFKAEYMAEITGDEEEEEESQSPIEFADELIEEGDVEPLVSHNSQRKEDYVDVDKIYTAYDELTYREARMVKKRIEEVEDI